MNAPTVATPATPSNPKRKKALIALAVVVAVAGLAWVAYDFVIASHYESTDNAYVQGNVIQITPQTGGTVLAILADDTEFVKAGQPLVQLDPADARVALDQAEAALAQAVRQVRALYANNGTLQAQIALRNADVGKAQADVAKAADDVVRRQSLTGNGAVSKEELGHAQTQLAAAQTQLAAARSNLVAAQAGVSAAREQLTSNQALTDGVGVAQHPSVLMAAAKLREAFLATQRAALPSPVDGFVAKRTVQLGQRVAAGVPMMSIISLKDVWVDANFKEVQLRNIRIGQPVKLVADLYGKKTAYQGVVTGLGVGTGAAFSLLPAQNATGNWIKVVQRVPVRIALNAEQLQANPLRVGLSMDAEVDIRDQSGKVLADAPRVPAPAALAPISPGSDAAEEDVRRVIAANLGRSGKALVASPARPLTAAHAATL